MSSSRNKVYYYYNDVSIYACHDDDVSLVIIHPSVQLTGCSQEVTPMQKQIPIGSTPKTICYPFIGCRDITTFTCQNNLKQMFLVVTRILYYSGDGFGSCFKNLKVIGSVCYMEYTIMMEVFGKQSRPISDF